MVTFIYTVMITSIKMVEIKSRVTKMGGTYGIYLPKALVECGVVEKGKRYKWKLIEEVTDLPRFLRAVIGSPEGLLPHPLPV